MKKTYKRITYAQRLQMEVLVKAKTPFKQIAQILKLSLSAIYYEYHKGTYQHLNTDYTTKTLYSADIAQRKADFNRTTQGAQLKIDKDYTFVKFVEQKIKRDKLSPNATLMYIKTHNLQFKTTICRTTLYNYIYNGIFLNLSAKDLLRKGKRKRIYKQPKPQTLPFRTPIDKRPIEATLRSCFGHWEMDSVIGKREGQGESLLVLTERKTRYEIILRSHKNAKATLQALQALKRKYGKHFPHIFKSITCDNGSEFKCDTLNTICPIYYCHPYSSWERGSNENQNAFIRRFIPKSTPIESITEEQLQAIQEHINNYPRLLFEGASSKDLYEAEIKKIKNFPKTY